MEGGYDVRIEKEYLNHESYAERLFVRFGMWAVRALVCGPGKENGTICSAGQKASISPSWIHY